MFALAAIHATTPAAKANTICFNSGSLGIQGDASNTDTVGLSFPGVVTAYGDFSTQYNVEGGYTRLPHMSQVNPPLASDPFTIEFWAWPTNSDNDDAPVDNRIASGNRSGWAFFQRATGWNFRTYNGNGSATGFDITAGPATLNTWSHVVATWDGTNAKLYVNGVLSTAQNLGSGGYSPSTTATLTIGALGDGSSPYNGRVDEIAFYGSALSAEKITAHYNTVSNGIAGAYSNMVKDDGAIVYYQQNPATISIADEGVNKIVTFRGILSQSTDLDATTWQDLSVTSPYTVTPAMDVPKLFFRAHR